VTVDARIPDSIPETPLATPTGPVLAPARTRLALSPLNRRRWENFKSNRRGYLSLWIFMVLFVVSLLAEFIANDQPLYVRYDGKSYFPVFFTYADTVFAEPGNPDVFGTAAEYRKDPDLIARIEKNGWILWPPIRFSYGTVVGNPPMPFPSKPTWRLTKEDCEKAIAGNFAHCDDKLEPNWLGTDMNGRDVVARLIYGFRISVLFGLILTVLSSLIGVAAGAVQGYFGGWTDLLFQRFIEIWTSIPELYLLMILANVLAQGFFILLGILLLFSWVRLVGVVRAEFLRGRNFEYIQAARALGVSNRVIMFRHLLPNAMVATMTYVPFILSGSVMTLTALDFLGFGLPTGSPSLGELLNEGKANVGAWWLGLSAFFTVAIMLSLLIFIGEAVRDAFDPRKTFR
jgi:microcin C transport system permease protein